MSTIFELEDDALWKKMDESQIKQLPSVPHANLMNSDLDVLGMEEDLEKSLKKKCEQIRKDEAHENTKWDK